MWSKVIDGRVLDVWKTLHYYDDIVELRDGQMIKGELELDGKSEGWVKLCPGLKEMPFADIRKIAYAGEAVGQDGEPKKRFLVYSENSELTTDPDSKPFQTKWCDTITPNITFDGNVVDIDKLQDLVPRLRVN